MLNERGKYVCEGATADIADSFGHKQLGTARVLADSHEKFGWLVRSIEFSLLQSCAAFGISNR